VHQLLPHMHSRVDTLAMDWSPQQRGITTCCSHPVAACSVRATHCCHTQCTAPSSAQQQASFICPCTARAVQLGSACVTSSSSTCVASWGLQSRASMAALSVGFVSICRHVLAAGRGSACSCWMAPAGHRQHVLLACALAVLAPAELLQALQQAMLCRHVVYGWSRY
jgi:hypothetical protein